MEMYVHLQKLQPMHRNILEVEEVDTQIVRW